jgi:hypothetical protein
MARLLVHHVHESGGATLVATLEEREVTAVTIGRNPRATADLLDGVRELVLVELISRGTQDSKAGNIEREGVPRIFCHDDL